MLNRNYPGFKLYFIFELNLFLKQTPLIHCQLDTKITMQEEIAKHTKKIFKSAGDSEKRIGERIREIALEIFIIVFAVTLSIWLHNWSEHRNQQREAREFLSDLKEDLGNDIISMQSAHDSLSKNLANFEFLNAITVKNVDSTLKAKGSVDFHASVGTTKISSGNYEGFKSSGKIGYLENKELKKDILKYYTDAIPSLIEAEKINATEILDISNFWADNADKEFVKIITSPKLKILLANLNGTATSSLKLYEDAISLAQAIIKKIDEDYR
ncbi:MAG: DUF6090 family protein [Flavobacterium sp.]